MKRIISLIITLSMLISIVPTAFAAEFSDFNSSHWAYEYVTALVNDGTINGYADGTFRPEGTVTRAEFVKMIGIGPEAQKVTFDDVTSSHWAYNYIVSSGLGALKGNLFMPDTPITRGDVAVLLWKRAGSPQGITAPPVVHRQGSNSDAISWVYTNGIMVGNDYMDLRLGDTLTRGEASALIIRSRSVNSQTPKTNFIASVDPQIFETVYNAFKLIDRPYDENSGLTNGELAYAAARLYTGADTPMYDNISAMASFDHPYAKPINMLCRYYLGMENDNASYADKNATVKEAIASVMFATLNSAGVYFPQGANIYPEITQSLNAGFDAILRRAYANGVWFDSASNINPDKDITMKELSCLVLECNGFAGYHNATFINSEKTEIKKMKIRTDVSTYPLNSSDYRIILASVPNNVYEKAFVSAKSLPKDSYKLTNEFSDIFASMLETWVKALSRVGYKLEVTYYHGVSVDNGNGYTLRTCIKFKDVPANSKLGDLINCVNALDGETIVNSGDVIYADIDTGRPLSDIYIPIDDMVLSQIIK